MAFDLMELINQYYLITLTGFVIGVLISITGVGGGVLVVPVLFSFFSFPPIAAVGTASLYSALTKVMATAEHARIKNINFQLSNRFLGGAIIGLLITAGLLSLAQIYTSADFQAGLQVLVQYLVIVTLFGSLLLFVNEWHKQKAYQKTLKNITDTTDSLPSMPQSKWRNNPVALVVSGCGVGAIMGLTGVGGGVLIIPALAVCTSLDTKKIVGSSIYIAMTVSLLTALLYSSSKSVDYYAAIFMTIGSILAIPVGSKIIRIISQSLLQYFIFALIVICIVLMIIRF